MRNFAPDQLSQAIARRATLTVCIKFNNECSREEINDFELGLIVLPWLKIFAEKACSVSRKNRRDAIIVKV